MHGPTREAAQITPGTILAVTTAQGTHQKLSAHVSVALCMQRQPMKGTTLNRDAELAYTALQLQDHVASAKGRIASSPLQAAALLGETRTPYSPSRPQSSWGQALLEVGRQDSAAGAMRMRGSTAAALTVSAEAPAVTSRTSDDVEGIFRDAQLVAAELGGGADETGATRLPSSHAAWHASVTGMPTPPRRWTEVHSYDDMGSAPHAGTRGWDSKLASMQHLPRHPAVWDRQHAPTTAAGPTTFPTTPRPWHMHAELQASSPSSNHRLYSSAIRTPLHGLTTLPGTRGSLQAATTTVTGSPAQGPKTPAVLQAPSVKAGSPGLGRSEPRAVLKAFALNS